MAYESKSRASTKDEEELIAQGSAEEIQTEGNPAETILRAALMQHHELYKNASLDPFNMADTYAQAMMSIWSKPDALIAAQTQYFTDSMKLWSYAASRMMGSEGSEPVIEPKRGDNRWRSEDWSENFIFDYIKQSYLLSARCIETTVEGVESLDEKESKRLAFFTQQFLDAMAPTNYPHTNPDVLKATLENKGENLISGLKNFVRDMEEGDGKLKIAMTDPNAFTLGENVATTPGKVVFQNRMLQLIQYTPTTEKVYKRPLLVVPPWINKYYILDLQPKNSMMKWLTDQGHTVFVVSWVNPDDEEYLSVGWDDYVKEGIYAAVEAVLDATDEKDLNVAGYCIGGTLLASTLAHMAETGDERIKTATFFTSLIDFSDPGDLGVFIDDQQVESLEKNMQGDGFLQGKSMSTAFNMLRSNDLIWSFYINNYLLGKDPTIFDLLYWNSDSTNMPATMHSFYLRNMYLENKLCKPKGIKVDGVEIDVRKIEVPSYFISAKDDHIAPWLSTYEGAKLLSGPVRFVLGGSGHIAGIVNPPVKNKYGYSTGPAKLLKDADAWLDKAKDHEGSWWVDWDKWLVAKGKTKVDARQPGSGKLSVIEDAPGSYVTKRI